MQENINSADRVLAALSGFLTIDLTVLHFFASRLIDDDFRDGFAREVHGTEGLAGSGAEG